MSSSDFWRIVDRLQIPDAEALELIGYPGKAGRAGQRPRFRLSSRQTRLASYLPEVEAALRAIGESSAWLKRKNKAPPFGGRAPLEWMAEQNGQGVAKVLQFLNLALLRRSLR
jgi:hypothetical protein